MIVNIEEIYRAVSELKAINELNLKDIEFYENGKKIDISDEIIENWKFIGLNNHSFIMSEFYKDGIFKTPKAE